MIPLRRFIRAERHLAVLLLAAALAWRALLPAGTMPVSTGGAGISIALCDGTGVAGRHLSVPVKGTSGHDDAPGHDHPCTFSVLAMALDTGANALPALPSVPVADIAPPAPRLGGVIAPPRSLRPPARAPPSLA